MKKSFEDRLIELSGPAELKAAKQLLKQDRLAGAWHDREQWLCGRFRLPGVTVDTRLRTGENSACECTCRSKKLKDGKLCEHAVALTMYAGRFHIPQPDALRNEAATYYGGLKQESLPNLIERARIPVARLNIEAVSAFPHVPSKWENATLAVKLRTADREYLGNLNNLRQLYFDKSLTVTLKLEHFSLHEQQIIRFLAINGEAENSQILLNAELTAEFFHCLVNFPRFTRDGRRLLVRGEFAEAVLLCKQSGRGKPVLSPGIRVNGAGLPTAGAKVITGKAGCWIGREGEYFFIPATCEISWLRNFFRSGAQNPPEGTSVEEFLKNFPLPVVPVDTLELATRDAGILLDGKLSGANEFTLEVNYLYETDYGHALQKPGSGYLVREGKNFWKRDENAERRFDTELALFGFDFDGDTPALHAAERIGTFLDRALPEIMVAHPRLALGGRLAAMIRGSSGLPELEFQCRLSLTKPDAYVVSYTLTGAGVPADWKLCAETVKQGGDFVVLPRAGMIKIPRPLAAFFPAAANVIRSLDPEGRTFEVPFYAANYFTHLVREIPGALVPEIAAGPEAAARSFDAAPDYRFEGELRGYQSEGVKYMQWMTDRNFNVILADEMGLGKTVQLLALLASRKLRSSPPALIVCPASLVANWEREAHKFVPGFRVAAPAGHDRADMFKEVNEYDLVILSYAAARLSADKLKHCNFSFLVLDEAQHIKNPGSSNAKNCKSIAAAHRIVLSGTPLENSPEDLWSIMDFLQPGMLGTLPAFRRAYSNLREDPALQQDLAARIGPFIKRRTKAQVATDLPPKSELALYCEMEPAQRDLYEKVRKEGLAQLAKYKEGDARGNATVFTTLLRLRQICCHPALLPDGKGDGIPSAKTDLLFELLHENIDSNHKMLLFSQFTSLLALTVKELNAEGIPFEYLDGSTRNRQERVDHFNNSPEIPLFLLSLKAGGTGLNLTSADTVIIYDPWWNPAVELQAADRTHRIGQTRAVSSVKLVVKDSIEEKILELQERKREIFDSVIDNPDAMGVNLSIDELKYLLD